MKTVSFLGHYRFVENKNGGPKTLVKYKYSYNAEYANGKMEAG
jgi:hypothetical protein